ncbi:2,5-dichloro-2,5-cyclohexadiene-1,4-diol dehydrogenase LinX [Sinobacterium norvegicum]|uniref:2,5-dichloro-2,5-cyclohexadiene-1,4-diol dehydrogenase LinX n=1 Tax=Sinobacterium norvegicum TaxID=1641715 RepID=A0ABM9AC46_9GAMM|nr:SDR family oxidoreductase [Sinobacterium norvegicum]CAH0990194.1 2,5-dichloro-2,5-cyclohexadiene-1,4-diol dehydrogenase LinX [Sinobacterium norvegicum]
MDKMKQFNNKIALVSGAASGIGLAVAKKFAEQGADLFIIDINAEALAKAAAGLNDAGTRVEYQVVDVSDGLQCQQVIEDCIASLGGIDILCNIAGYAKSENFTMLTQQDWLAMVGVNLNSVFFLCHAAMPSLLERGGNIVNMSSTAGLEGQAYNSMYSATKGAVISLTKSLAMEFAGKGVRVNAICPGAVNTPLASKFTFPEGADMALFARMFPLMDAAEAEEIAEAVSFVASDKARYMTGVALPLDGGSSVG